jgi:hypothetical protein
VSPGNTFDNIQFSGTSDLYLRITPSSNPVYGETPAVNGKEYVPFYYWVLFLFLNSSDMDRRWKYDHENWRRFHVSECFSNFSFK